MVLKPDFWWLVNGEDQELSRDRWKKHFNDILEVCLKKIFICETEEGKVRGREREMRKQGLHWFIPQKAPQHLGLGLATLGSQESNKDLPCDW